MASITSKVSRDGVLVDIVETPKLVTNIQVINKIYAAVDMDELLNDEAFMNIIASNGYYKAAFCDKFMLESAVITIGTKSYKFLALREGLNIADLVQGNTDVIPIDIELVDIPL
jgi:hypothetical protein